MTSEFTVQIAREGKPVTVLSEEKTGEDAFNTAETEWVEDYQTHAVRTYPNRNAVTESATGDYVQDNPVFLFPPGGAPDAGQRIEYDGIEYELQAPTPYDTHVAFFGKPVRE